MPELLWMACSGALRAQLSSNSVRDQEAVLEVALREQSKFQSLNKMLGTEQEASKRTLLQLDQTKQVRLEFVTSQVGSAGYKSRWFELQCGYVIHIPVWQVSSSADD